jgi:hypothetical protein
MHCHIFCAQRYIYIGKFLIKNPWYSDSHRIYSDNGFACLGHLWWSNTKMNYPICDSSPKVAKVSKAGILEQHTFWIIIQNRGHHWKDINVCYKFPYTRLERLARGNNSNLLYPFVSYKENEVLRIWPLELKVLTGLDNEQSIYILCLW